MRVEPPPASGRYIIPAAVARAAASGGMASRAICRPHDRGEEPSERRDGMPSARSIYLKSRLEKIDGGRDQQQRDVHDAVERRHADVGPWHGRPWTTCVLISNAEKFGSR